MAKNLAAASEEWQPVLDTETLDGIRALQSPEEPHILLEVVRMYLEQLPERLAHLEGALKSQSASAIFQTAHALKSSSVSVGAIQLGQALAALEDPARGGKLPDSKHWEPVRAAAHEAERALRALPEMQGVS